MRHRTFGNASALAAATLAAWVNACATTTPVAPPRDIAGAESRQQPAAELEAGTDGSTESDFVSASRVMQSGLSCRQSAATARRALTRMGYEVTDVRRPEPGTPGEVRAIKHTGWDLGEPGPDYYTTVRITCNNQGAGFDASTTLPFTGRISFQRDFPKQIAYVANRKVTRPKAKQAQVESGLSIEVDPQHGSSSQVFAIDFGAAGITPVRVHIRNITPQTYIFETSRLHLVTQEGQRRSALPTERVVALVAEEARAAVRGNSLGNSTIDPNTTLEGYLFFPVSTYRRAKIVLTDKESDEAEGFAIEF